jgi:hypothetical protein
MSLPVGVSLGDGTVVLLLADPTPVSSTGNEGSTSADLSQRSFVADELLPQQPDSEY